MMMSDVEREEPQLGGAKIKLKTKLTESVEGSHGIFVLSKLAHRKWINLINTNCRIILHVCS